MTKYKLVHLKKARNCSQCGNNISEYAVKTDDKLLCIECFLRSGGSVFGRECLKDNGGEHS